MKQKESNFDDFKRNQLTIEGKKSITGGLPPTQPVPPFELEDFEEPQWGGPIVLSSTGSIKQGEDEIRVSLP
ncbi:hypothetical protein [Flavobacterium sp.]|uniref:hypothetical protein n=1 Tax=Flavobacterium sp. TaxID=239 RepID=UPI003D6A6106